ncbi:fructosamine kinase family protein [Flexivirga meconopsidis]|uniref:fructosamine kinase family protein n=1 Tax=Flexivirga meconopsidis TaxID=2977121 RepID=UPI00223F6326
MTAGDFVKPVASERAGAWEAAGLSWLRVPGGAPVVGVEAVSPDRLVLQRLSPSAPSAAQVESFGRQLAATHAAGASGFGVGPDGWTGDGLQGPADDLIPLPLGSYDAWGAMYADLRVEPLARQAGLGGAAEGLLGRLRGGEFDESVAAPARLHGDLWAGNVVWTAAGGVLIDPAAHGGHPESDLGALTLFGAPHLERLLASYIEVAGVADGWRDRLPLMQLHLVLLHAVLFGGGYVGQAASILRRYA